MMRFSARVSPEPIAQTSPALKSPEPASGIAYFFRIRRIFAM
jgi:hypothetical protein